MTSWPAASPVRTSRRPGSESASEENAPDSGPSSLGSLGRYDPTSSSWRTSQLSLDEAWAESSVTWPRSGTVRRGIAFAHPTWTPRTDETASSHPLAHAERDGLRKLAEWHQPDETFGRDDVPRDEGTSRALADADGRRREVFRLAEPSGLEGSRRGVSDGCHPLRELDDAETPDADLAGRSQFGGSQPSGQERASAELRRRGSAESGMGRGIDGISSRMDLRGWGPGWEDGIPRTAPPVRGRVARLEALGNAVVPAVARLAWLTLAARLRRV